MRFSACIVVQSESFAIRKSVESIIPFVDEVVVLENGSVDSTKEILRKLQSELPGLVKVLFEADDTNLAVARNSVQEEATGDWIVWWDGDFIAYGDEDGTERSLRRLVDDIRQVGCRANQVLYSGPSVGPTFETTLKDNQIHGATGDTQITRKGFMWFEVGEFIDTRRYSEERKCVYYNKGDRWHFLHLDVKHPEKLGIRPFIYNFQKDRAVAGDEGRDLALKDWYRANHGHFDLDAIVNRALERISRDIVPFDFERWGKHPIILESLVEHCPFVIKRNPVGDMVVRVSANYKSDIRFDLFGR